MDRIYYNKLLQEKADVEKTSYWAEIWKEIRRMREYSRDRCEENKDDTRFFQGEASAFKKTMALPERIIEDSANKLHEK